MDIYSRTHIGYFLFLCVRIGGEYFFRCPEEQIFFLFKCLWRFIFYRFQFFANTVVGYLGSSPVRCPVVYGYVGLVCKIDPYPPFVTDAVVDLYIYSFSMFDG